MGDRPGSGTVNESGTGPSLSLDTILELLANRRRRFALYTFADAPDGVVTLEALVEDVATLEASIARTALTRDRYLEAASELHHWHLAMLSDLGLLEYDERSGAIRYRGHPRLEAWTRRVRDEELSPDRDE